MREKRVALILALVLIVTGTCLNTSRVNAETSTEDVNFSEIWTEDALVGYAELITRGVYLAQGISTINDAGSGKIGTGGITTAARDCKVSVNVIVEKKVSGSWTRVTSYSATKTYDITVSASKYVYVSSGYYYRVRSVHSAASDTSSSCTSSLWM